MQKEGREKERRKRERVVQETRERERGEGDDSNADTYDISTKGVTGSHACTGNCEPGEH